MTIDDTGTIWIADTLAARLLAYTKAGERKAVFPLSDRVVSIWDVAARGDRLAVLDIASPRPMVLVLDRLTGRVLQEFAIARDLGLESGLSGLSYGPSGELLLEFSGGLRTAVVGQSGLDIASVADGRPVDAGRFLVEDLADPTTPRSHASVQFGSTSIEVAVRHYLGGIYLVGERETSFDLLVDEFRQDSDGAIVVDRTIRRFTISGQPLAIGRINLADHYSYVAHGVEADRDGDILALVPRQDRLDVVRARLASGPSTSFASSTAALPGGSEGVAVDSEGFSVLSCVDRRLMDYTRAGYTGNSTFLNDANINGACAGRMKPRYLGAPGNYSGVSYKWGGWETVSAWNSNMASNRVAGDINTTWEACDHGVDCSGFVQRIWQLSDKKYDTSALASSIVSHSVPVGSLIAYDAYVKPGTHIMIWHRWEGSGLMISESTTSGALDRTVYRWVDSSYINGYVTRRLNNVCA